MSGAIEHAVRELPPPYYLVDLDALRARFAAIDRAFTACFDDFVLACSYKTNYWPSVLRTLHSVGAWAEVVSDLEFALACRFGVSTERIIFNGPIKSDEAIEQALGGGSLLHVDSLDEARRVADLARDANIDEGRVGLRVNVGHPEHTDHRARSRFGVPSADIEPTVRLLSDAGLHTRGLHAHLATKARSLDHFAGLIAELGEVAKLVGIPDLEWIDVGGGFGFAPSDLEGRVYPSFESYAECIRESLAAVHPFLPEKRLVIEPGMALVNDAVRFVASVRATKTIGGRRLAFLDASIQTLKPTRHGFNLPTRVFDEHGTQKRGESSPWDLVGYTCIDDDFIAIDHPMPSLESGDRVEFRHVGAYTFVFKPPFIRAMPAVWAVDGDRVIEAARAETLDDFLRCYEGDTPK